MKGIMILTLLVMAGCSGFVPMEELEAQALATGDWSEVEKRERLVARRDMRTGLVCAPGTTAYCETALGAEECRCVESEVLSAYFSR